LSQLIRHPGTNQIETFADGKVKLIAVKASKKGKLVGKELKNINDDMPDVETHVPVIYRKNKPLKPSGSTIIKENDELYFITSAENIDSVVNEVQKDHSQHSRIFIVGGGKIGFNLAKDLESDFNVKLVERDKARCKLLSEELERSIVLHGSGSDEELLSSENIDQTDVFCALTNDDEANIMSSFLAKKLGAKKTMILVNNISYMDIIPKRFIDNVIAPYRLTISLVMQDLREADFAQDVLLKMHLGAEAVEGVVHSNPFTSGFIGKPVVDLPIPEEASIGAIVRDEKILMPSNDLMLSIDDHLIVFFTDKQAIPEIENYFREV
jgi:trk system potassium uptake protein TrkA